MIDWLTHSTGFLIGGGVAALIACGAVWYFFPPFRRLAISIGGVILAATAIYAKGASDARREEKAKSDAAAKRIGEKYDQIDARTDTDRDVDDRLRSGKF